MSSFLTADRQCNMSVSWPIADSGCHQQALREVEEPLASVDSAMDMHDPSNQSLLTCSPMASDQLTKDRSASLAAVEISRALK